jgi:hypothetical protein
MKLKYIFLLSACLFSKAFAAPADPMVTVPAKLNARQDDQSLVGYMSVPGVGCQYH